MNSVSNENKYSITDSGWVMYESFTENMNTLNKKLPITLFNKCWPTLASTFSTVCILVYIYTNAVCIIIYDIIFYSLYSTTYY